MKIVWRECEIAEWRETEIPDCPGLNDLAVVTALFDQIANEDPSSWDTFEDTVEIQSPEEFKGLYQVNIYAKLVVEVSR